MKTTRSLNESVTNYNSFIGHKHVCVGQTICQLRLDVKGVRHLKKYNKIQVLKSSKVNIMPLMTMNGYLWEGKGVWLVWMLMGVDHFNFERKQSEVLQIAFTGIRCVFKRDRGCANYWRLKGVFHFDNINPKMYLNIMFCAWAPN